MKSAKLLILAYRTLKKGHVSIAEKIVEEALSDESAPALMETLYSIVNKENKATSDIDDGTVDNKNNNTENDDDVVDLEEDTDDTDGTDIDDIVAETQDNVLGTDDDVKTMEKTAEDLPDTEKQLEGKEVKKAEDLPSTKDQLVDVEIADVLTNVQIAQLKAIINRISSKGNKKDLANRLIANLLK